jgi:hypothetical protein
VCKEWEEKKDAEEIRKLAEEDDKQGRRAAIFTSQSEEDEVKHKSERCWHCGGIGRCECVACFNINESACLICAPICKVRAWRNLASYSERVGPSARPGSTIHTPPQRYIEYFP